MKRLFALLLSLATLVGCKPSTNTNNNAGTPPPPGGGGKQLTVAFLPKSKGNAFFAACRVGAEEAAQELGIKLLYDGPTGVDPAAQNTLVEQWITRGVDVICAACENSAGITSALKKAREKGIRVITWDADALPEGREFFVNQATPDGIAKTLVDECARLIGPEGKYAIIIGTPTAGNMIAWQQSIEKYNAEKYPALKRLALRPSDDIKDKAFAEATAIMSAHPDVQLLMAICSPAVPGSAEAVKQAGKVGQVKVIGLGLPSENRKYVKEGVTDAVILWKVHDLGYLTVHAAKALAEGRLKKGDTTFTAGRVGTVKIDGDNILLGTPIIFNKENIDQFDF